MNFPRIAILNETGKKVVVKRRQDFSPNVMTWWEPEAVEAPVEVPEVVEVEAPVVEPEAVDEKARFEELKAKRAWLHADTKEEYARLKAIYG